MIERHVLADGVTVANDSADHDYACSDELGVPTGSALLVKLSQTGSVSTTVAVRVSYDGTTWYDSAVETLVAAGARGTNVASITLSAATQAAICRLLCPAPYISVRLNNSGAAGATVTVTLLAPR